MNCQTIYRYRAIIIAIVLLVGNMVKLSAQETLVPMMVDLPQQTKYNPASVMSSDRYLVLPVVGGINLSMDNTAFCFDDMFTRDLKTDSLNLDLDKWAGNFTGSENVLAISLDMPIGAFWAKLPSGNSTFSFSIYNKTRGNLVLPKSILDLRYGNYDFERNIPISHTLSDIKFNAFNYMEFAIGYQTMIQDFLSIGANVKFLSGTAGMMSDNLKLSIKTYQDGQKYLMHVRTSGSINFSAPLDVKNDKEGYVDEIAFNSDNLGSMIGANNVGFGADLGVKAYLLDKKLQVGLSAIDLGFIKWTKNHTAVECSANFTYEGININDEIKDAYIKKDRDYWKELKDSLSSFKDMHSRNDITFKTKLNPTIIATGQYTLNKIIAVGAVGTLKVVNQTVMPRFTANLSVRPGKVFNGVLSAGVHPGGSIAMGLAGQVTAGPFQLMLASERIPFALSKTKGAQFTFGINWLLGSDSNNEE